MRSVFHRCLIVLLLGGCVLTADEPKKDKPALPDLSEYRTVDKAITTRLSSAAPATVGLSGYLGIAVAPDGKGKPTVDQVAESSPAARAGLVKGDVVVRLDGKEIVSADALAAWLKARAPDETVKLSVLRKDKPIEVSAVLGAVSRPMKAGPLQRAVLGISLEDTDGGKGVLVQGVTANGAADQAKVKIGDIIVEFDGIPVDDTGRLRDMLREKQPRDVIELVLRRGDKTEKVNVTLGAEDAGERRRGGGGWDDRLGGYWKKDVYRLAVVRIEYPDAKHNDKITARHWQEALFSKGTYTRQSATGQGVHGSVNDYYLEQSAGALRVEGKVFDWVEVSKKRTDYSQGTGTGNRSALLTEAVDKLLAREGTDALKDFDGIFFLYAGDRVQTTRGGLYWPHKANFSHQGKRWSYFIVSEGGRTMSSISVIAHEFGHMLGLPDLYARPENPGSEGAGTWCAMSNQSGNGRPQHFGVWCKEKLGWMTPAVIDPTSKQKLILGPIEGSKNQCFKVLIKPDGSEYLLLENRTKKGFDRSLPAEGLLIWRVVGNRPILEESHGVDGPAGPRVHLGSVPYPSSANDSFTPFTTPSSRSQLGGGLPVHITNIRRLPDGQVTFHVGYEYQ